MPIPKLTFDGFLPDGIHGCTFDEMMECFGESKSTSRLRLALLFRSYYEKIKKLEWIEYLIVDGSFTTWVDHPNDIDVLLIHRHDKLPSALTGMEYSLKSKRMARKNYDLHVFWIDEKSRDLQHFIDLFSIIRHIPERRKGVLRIKS